jgi:hypothetical protein
VTAALRYVLLPAAALLATAVAATAAPGHATKGPVPASLTAAESNAEDIVDVALARNRSGVVSIAAELKATANGSAAVALRQAGVPRTMIAQLEERADHLAAVAPTASYVSVLLAANSVSQLMAGLYAHFAGAVPPQIQTLDYLDREAQFRSLARQPAKVSATVKELAETWTRVRPKVIAAGGAAQAAAYGKHVAAMKRLGPSSAARVRAEAVHGLELVDALEQVFG